MIPIITRHWWALVLRGVIGIVFGLLAIAFPPVTITILAVFFAAYLIIDGIFAVIAGIQAAEHHRRWWPFALEGVVGLIAGAVAFALPETTIVVMVALVAAWAVLSGLVLLIPAYSISWDAGKGWLLLNGVLSLLLGIVIIVQPIAGVLFIVWSVAIYAILFGAVFVALGFRVRRLHHRPHVTA